MFKLSIALLILSTLLAPAQQLPAASNIPSSGKFSIPAQLLKTVRADKVHPGDPVEFRTVEAVLVDNGLVMPVNTSLHGRVLSASPKRDDKNSWLAFVVEKAAWKEHTLPLHAFVSAQIVVSTANRPHPPDTTANPASTTPRVQRRQSVRVAARSDPELSNLVPTPQDANDRPPEESGVKYPMLENVGILRDKDGTTYLLSAKSTVKLPAGVLLMLSNEPASGLGPR
jgi:hypothetical protein